MHVEDVIPPDGRTNFRERNTAAKVLIGGAQDVRIGCIDS